MSAQPRSLLRDLTRSPRALLSTVWIALVLLAGLAAPLLAPADPLEQDIANRLLGPSAQHPLGTDTLGRDLLSRIMYGGADVLAGIAVALIVALALGLTLGLAAGYLRGPLAFACDRIFESLLAIPGIVIMLMVVAVFGQKLLPAMVALGVLLSSQFYRLAEAGARAVRGRAFVDASRVAGLASIRIMLRHVLPNMIRPVIIQASLVAATVIILLSGLSFLGLGPPPPDPQWGLLIQEASQNILIAPWLMVPTGAAIILTAFAFTSFGDALTELASPATARPRTLGPSAKRGGEAPSTEALLDVQGLTVSFPAPQGQVQVVTGVDLRLQPGRTLALVGESGCGKTMTALAIAGLLPSTGTTTAQRLDVAGRSMQTATEDAWQQVRGQGVSYIPQEPMTALDPTFTVGSQLVAPLRRLRGLNRSQARAAALELLAQVGIADPAAAFRSHPHQLSGGMAQRVCIAIALTGNPRLLIADEPTTALDVTVQAEILDLLKDLQQQTGVGIVLVTHDWGVVADVADDVAVMYAGEIVEFGSAEEIFANPTHPYSALLLRSAPRPEHAGGILPTIPGLVPAPDSRPDGCRFQNRCPLALPTCVATPVHLQSVRPEHDVRCKRADVSREELAHV